MSNIKYLIPRNGGIKGKKIGFDGNRLYLFGEQFVINLTTPLVERTERGDSAPSFAASRYVYGQVMIAGSYTVAPEDDVCSKVIGEMRTGNTITNVELTLDTGRAYTGDLFIKASKTQWSDSDKQQNVTIAITAQFDGVITGDGVDDGTAQDSLVSGDVYEDVKAGAAHRLGAQDSRKDSAVRPFLIENLDESTVDLDHAIGMVVDKLGGWEHTYGGNVSGFAAMKIVSTEARWVGKGVVAGVLFYGRGNLDCAPNGPLYSIGYREDGTGITQQVVVGADDSGDDVCADNGITVVNNIKRRVPLTVVRIPGVWDSDPRGDANIKAMIGKINDASYTLGTVAYDAYEVRVDGLEGVSTFDTPLGQRWAGYFKCTVMDGGWIAGQLTCSRWVPLPPVGTQTIGGYAIEYARRFFYEYVEATFSNLATIIPICYA